METSMHRRVSYRIVITGCDYWWGAETDEEAKQDAIDHLTGQVEYEFNQPPESVEIIKIEQVEVEDEQ